MTKKRASNQVVNASVAVEEPARKVLRAISACKRCRFKKIKCSRDFPKCKACVKAGVECVAVDAATGREVPRSYVVHLESRIDELEKQLAKQGEKKTPDSPDSAEQSPLPMTHSSSSHSISSGMMDQVEISTVGSGSAPPSAFIGASSGITFAKLMFTAVNFKESDGPTIKNNAHRRSIVDPSMMKDEALLVSHIALLPPKQQALSFVQLFFAQSNSQLPIFHRETFLRKYFQPIYGSVPDDCSFASDHSSINKSSLIDIDEKDTWYYQYAAKLDEEISKDENLNPFKFSASVEVPQQFQKPLYFMNIIFAIASSSVHLQYPEKISEEFKNAALKCIDQVYSSSDRLEALQGILCLTLYSLMRPSVPGCWYLLGSGLRLAVDLGLHFEINAKTYDAFTLDMRRRIFWCCYSLDRQICVYLGRPFGIPEESCHVPLPSKLDDALINPNETEIKDYSKEEPNDPSYKSVSLSMIRIRLLQAEIQSVLYDRRELPRRFASINDWYADMSRRVEQWHATVPKTEADMNCTFNAEFFNLNYHHTRIMLNGLAPAHFNLDTLNYIILAESAKGMIISYNALYKTKHVNYTWAATHNLFMAGASYLYAIFNCDEARNRAPIAEVQGITLICNSILNGLKNKCIAAANCRDVFEILTAAVIKLKYTDNIVHLDKVPTAESVAKLQPGQYLPENVRNLISALPESIRNKTVEEVVTNANVDSFEWSTNEADLDRFFMELNRTESPETSSATSPINQARRHTFNANVDDYGPSALHSQLSPATQFSPGSQISNNSSQPPSHHARDGRRVYKMLSQPTESIWDQFFTTQYGYN